MKLIALVAALFATSSAYSVVPADGIYVYVENNYDDAVVRDFQRQEREAKKELVKTVELKYN